MTAKQTEAKLNTIANKLSLYKEHTVDAIEQILDAEFNCTAFTGTFNRKDIAHFVHCIIQTRVTQLLPDDGSPCRYLDSGALIAELRNLDTELAVSLVARNA